MPGPGQLTPLDVQKGCSWLRVVGRILSFFLRGRGHRVDYGSQTVDCAEEGGAANVYGISIVGGML